MDAIGQRESDATVRAPEHIEERLAFERQRLSNPDAFHELEVGVVFVQHSVDAISFHASPLHELTQLDQVIRGRQRHDQDSSGGQDAGAFGRISPPVDREDDIYPIISEGQSSIRVGHDPRKSGNTSRRDVDGRHRQIDSDTAEGTIATQALQHLARPATKIDGHGIGTKLESADAIDDGSDDRVPDAQPIERRACLDGSSGITGIRRAAVLRLQQVDVAAARDVEGMTSRAHIRTRMACEWQTALAHGAREGNFSGHTRFRRDLPTGSLRPRSWRSGLWPAYVPAPATPAPVR